jgi:hypothetical protein
MASIKLTGDTSGEITISAPAVAGTNTLTLPAATGTLTTTDVATNTPIFSAYMSADTTGSDNTVTKVEFDSVEIDTNSAFDTSLYRFTVPSGGSGKYQVNACVRVATGVSANLVQTYLSLHKNGSAFRVEYDNYSSNYLRDMSKQLSVVVDLSDGDYLEIYAFGNTQNSGNFTVTSGVYSNFSAYKLIG